MFKKTMVMLVIIFCSAFSAPSLAACKLGGFWYVTTSDVEVGGWTYCIIKLRANSNVIRNQSICVNHQLFDAAPTGDVDLQGCDVSGLITYPTTGATIELAGRMMRNGKLISGVGVSTAVGNFTFTAIR